MSYSQYNEEEIIKNFFQGKIGNFLDLGAACGIQNSNTRALSDLGWTGTCVEANPNTFLTLRHNHLRNPNILCVCAAVMNYRGVVRFNQSTVPQLSTCVDDVLGKYHECSYGVACIQPDAFADEPFKPFDFVSLDLEGVDYPVLKRMTHLLKGTKLLCFEDSVPFKEFSQEYYDAMIKECNRMGFTKVIARTNEPNGNTLIARP